MYLIFLFPVLPMTFIKKEFTPFGLKNNQDHFLVREHNIFLKMSLTGFHLFFIPATVNRFIRSKHTDPPQMPAVFPKIFMMTGNWKVGLC